MRQAASRVSAPRRCTKGNTVSAPRPQEAASDPAPQITSTKAPAAVSRPVGAAKHQAITKTAPRNSPETSSRGVSKAPRHQDLTPRAGNKYRPSRTTLRLPPRGTRRGAVVQSTSAGSLPRRTHSIIAHNECGRRGRDHHETRVLVVL